MDLDVKRKPGRALSPLAGRTFGRLTALERDGSDASRKPWWRCKDDHPLNGDGRDEEIARLFGKEAP